MDQLIAAIEKNTAVMERLLEIEEAKLTQSDWMTPEEAARELGLNITKSNYHRRRLNEGAKRHGVRIRNTRPPAYWREDIYTLSRKIRDGRAVV